MVGVPPFPALVTLGSLFRSKSVLVLVWRALLVQPFICTFLVQKVLCIFCCCCHSLSASPSVHYSEVVRKYKQEHSCSAQLSILVVVLLLSATGPLYGSLTGSQHCNFTVTQASFEFERD